MTRKVPVTRRKSNPSSFSSGKADGCRGAEQGLDFFQSVTECIRSTRTKVYRAVNFAMIEAYWNVGRMIVEQEQRGNQRADYGVALIEKLSLHLSRELGEGFSESNLWNFRQFYLTFTAKNPRNGKLDALRRELTWTHYRLLMRVENPAARTWYMNEAAEQNWSTRALRRQIHSLYYERLLMSGDRTSMIEELQQEAALPAEPQDYIKDPYVLEFLGIPDVHSFREADLEQAIIDKLQHFMLELGKGFAFVARQKRISTETRNFFIDLVFYNYHLKCFVLVDLKAGELTHQDIGQMDMYVRLFEDAVKGKDDNPTVGLILCTEKDNTVVKYSVLNESRQLFASRYRLYLPTEEELRKEIEREREQVVREQRAKYETGLRNLDAYFSQTPFFR